MESGDIYRWDINQTGWAYREPPFRETTIVPFDQALLRPGGLTAPWSRPDADVKGDLQGAMRKAAADAAEIGVVGPDEIERIRGELERALGLNAAPRWGHPDGKFRRRLPLPLKTRMRLRAQRRVDRLCAWLCGVRCERAAMAIWKTTGMMKLCRSWTCPGCTALWAAGTPCTSWPPG